MCPFDYRRTFRGVTASMRLAISAEFGGWELSRVRLYPDGSRRRAPQAKEDAAARDRSGRHSALIVNRRPEPAADKITPSKSWRIVYQLLLSLMFRSHRNASTTLPSPR